MLAAHRGYLLAGRAGAARLRGGAQPRLPGDVRHALLLLPAGPADEHHRRHHVYHCRSAHRLREPGGLTWAALVQPTACSAWKSRRSTAEGCKTSAPTRAARSEEHTSELQSLMRISYAVFCLKKKTNKNTHTHTTLSHS